MNKTCQEKYGKNWYVETDECINALKESVGCSKPEQEFAALLNENKIDFEREFPLDGFKYDFKIGEYLFEINPSATHNSTFGLFGSPKNKMYHSQKTIVARSHGFHCVHIFDWDDQAKIVSLFLKNKDTIYARKCVIKEVDREDTINFINEYHLQGYAKDDIRIGLYFNDELVSIMTFGKPRYNNNYEYELVRYCSNKKVIGGAEKLFKYFVDKYDAKSIISYCDLSKFDGNVYSDLGFVCNKNPQPSKHWYNIKTKRHITDNLLRGKGYDKLFHENFGKGTSNEELMKLNGFVEIFDCGQKKYTWNR